ncbi:omega-hydroxyceramide transacylase-like isoform X3 [Ambystoma mexicanum]|uniref:omega-hydroxyceramide transacylase-like isoform X3 n=1 Tax=Ambystoma mexicanum TaxID=8296 RepID=UPI0037E79F14
MAEEVADAKASLSLSFSGSGFLMLYQVGAVQALQDLAPEILRSASRVYGASAGSLIATAVVCECNLDEVQAAIIDAAKEARECLFGPLFHVPRMVQAMVSRLLPTNAHQLASGRLHIGLTRLSDGENVMVSDYRSNEELTQALVCSCFVPFYCGIIPPSFRGVRYIDGGLTNMQPLFGLKSMITISPYTGEHDICPRDCPVSHFCFQIFNTSFQLSIENFCRLAYSLFPPPSVVMQEFHSQGYRDCVHYLHSNTINVCERQKKSGLMGTLVEVISQRLLSNTLQLKTSSRLQPKVSPGD